MSELALCPTEKHQSQKERINSVLVTEIWKLENTEVGSSNMITNANFKMLFENEIEMCLFWSTISKSLHTNQHPKIHKDLIAWIHTHIYTMISNYQNRYLFPLSLNFSKYIYLPGNEMSEMGTKGGILTLNEHVPGKTYMEDT